LVFNTTNHKTMFRKINIYRLPFQIAILAILIITLFITFFNPTANPDVEAFCPFGGLQATLGYLVTDSLACSMTTRQISLGVMLIIGVILVGKLFCSHICPIGTLSEWIGKFGKTKKLNWIPPYWLDKGLRIIKYALLFTTFYFTITSSELFCKKFDPYFASMSSNSGDILWITASISLIFVFILPIFITNFWCKYICPLGAIFNIFKILPIWLPAIIVIIGLQYFGIFSISWIVTLGIIILSACIVEVLKMRSYSIGGLHIVRENITCTDCKKCDKKCPMNINISDATTVNHIDCHLCGECITLCPKEHTLSFNKKKIRWVPSLILVVLISSGLLISAFTEVPTINQQWGKPDQMQRSESFIQENLSEIKCFGSSSSFATHMHEINGVVGVSCFAGKHSARIYFDPKTTSTLSIKEKIFEPSICIISFPNEKNQNVDILQLGINHFFDTGDADRLSERFADNKGIFAFSTSFGEPILTTIYFNRNQISVNELIYIIENQNYSFKHIKNASSQKTNFKTTIPNKKDVVIATHVIDLLYPTMDIALNKKDSYKKENIKSLTLNFQQSIINDNFIKIPHLMSHLSGDKGVLNFKATCKDGKPLLTIEYVVSKTDANKIIKTLNQPNLNVLMDDGENITIENPFFFKPIDIF
jgi:polyferredoxin